MRITGVEPQETRAYVVTESATTVLELDGVSDFDAPGFVLIESAAGTVQRAVVDVDTDEDTITLDASPGFTVPVDASVLSVSASGVPLVDFVAAVDTGNGQTRPSVSAEVVRTLGRDLVGATAVVEGDRVVAVSDVPSRESTEGVLGLVASAQSIPHSGSDPDAGWTTVLFFVFANGMLPQFDGSFRANLGGVYLPMFHGKFAPNPTGARRVRLRVFTYVGEQVLDSVDATTPSGFWPCSVQVFDRLGFSPGEGIAVEVWQNSGAALDLLDGKLTITRVGP